MSKSYYLENLLDGAEVEWVPLGEVVELKRGKRLVKSQLEETGDYPVYQNSMKPLGFYHEGNANSDSAFIISAGAAGEIGYSKIDFWAADDVYICLTASMMSSKFLYHCLLSQQGKILGQVRRASIPRLSKLVIEKLLIPIPCPNNPQKSLAIQTEIARILDAFTELTTELTTELSLRQKQYQYYRDLLLDFNDGEVEWKYLGDLATIGTGSRNTNESIDEGRYPFFVRSQSPLRINDYEFDETAIITAGDGVGVGKVFHYVNGKYGLHQRAYRIVVANPIINPKFLFYFFTSNFLQYITRASVHASVTSLRKPMFDKYLIPIPSLEKQAHIVAILDKFDTLTNSISSGLPREIELRQKQYEYYRDLLLSFD